MKIKHVLASLGLTMMCGIGALVGLTHINEAKVAKADEPNTWMFRAQLNLGVASPNYDSCVFSEDEAVLGAQFHVWGTNVDQTFDADYLCFHTFDFYAVNVALKDDQVITGAQWIINQETVGYKYSVDTNQFGDSANDHLDKDSNYMVIEWQFDNIWAGDKWHFVSDRNWGYSSASIQMHVDGKDPVDFVKVPAQGVFKASNVVQSNSSWVEMVCGNSVTLATTLYDIIDAASRQYVYSGSNQWFYPSTEGTGTFDYILGNSKITMKKHVSEYVGIYLVGIDADVRVYTFGEGGIEDFGAFPGTRLGDIANAQEVSGDLKFQGHDDEIWYLPLDYGYPEADHIILTYLNEFGNVGTKTADMLLVEGSAYWFSYDDDYHNDDAGLALRFLLDAEEIRADVAAAGDIKAGSVCGVSKSDAISLVNRYNALSSSIKTTYIDCTKVNTYKQNGEEGKEDVLYSDVMARLAIIAEVAISSNLMRAYGLNNNTAAVVILISVTFVAMSAGLFFVIRRRKVQK